MSVPDVGEVGQRHAQGLGVLDGRPSDGLDMLVDVIEGKLAERNARRGKLAQSIENIYGLRRRAY